MFADSGCAPSRRGCAGSQVDISARAWTREILCRAPGTIPEPAPFPSSCVDYTRYMSAAPWHRRMPVAAKVRAVPPKVGEAIDATRRAGAPGRATLARKFDGAAVACDICRQGPPPPARRNLPAEKCGRPMPAKISELAVSKTHKALPLCIFAIADMRKMHL